MVKIHGNFVKLKLKPWINWSTLTLSNKFLTDKEFILRMATRYRRISLLLKSVKEVSSLISYVMGVHSQKVFQDTTFTNLWRDFLTAIAKTSATETLSQRICCLTKNITLKLQTSDSDPQLREQDKVEYSPLHQELQVTRLQSNQQRNHMMVNQSTSSHLVLFFSLWSPNILLSPRLLPKTTSTSISEAIDQTFSGNVCKEESQMVTSLTISRISFKE